MKGNKEFSLQAIIEAMEIITVIIPLFTLGCIYSTNASRPRKCLKQINNLNQNNRVKNHKCRQSS